MEVDELKKKISCLEKENAYLRELLDRAGVSYRCSNRDNIIQEYNPHQEQRIIPFEINQNVARRFYSFFWGRTDVFSKRYTNKKTGNSGYFTQCDNFRKKGICPKVFDKKEKCKNCIYKQWTKLELFNIESHLKGQDEYGNDVIGIYPLFENGTCRFLVFDFDNHNNVSSNKDDNWKDEVNSLREICRINDIPVLVERSRSGAGAHIWIFFEKPVEASLARKFGFALLEKGAMAVNLKSFRYYDRMIPAQSEIEPGELGNLIALPLQGQALKNGNSAFIDENWNAFPNQLDILFSTERLSQQQIENFIADCKEQKFENDTLPMAQDETKPWERTSLFNNSDVEGKMKIILSNQIYIESKNLKPRIQNQIRRLAAFSNPVYFKNNAIGLSNYSQPRYIYLGEDDNGYICIPRGIIDKLEERCRESGIDYVIKDNTSPGRNIAIQFTGKLRDNQQKAVNELLKYNCGVLSAATAFGKTVTCADIISEKKTGTLILLESSSLVEQWEKALNKFLEINEEMPQYKTKTGQVKKRKSLIGIIQGSKDTSTGIIDIAMAGSLIKNGLPHYRLKDYGLVIIDECHHAASDTVASVLKEIKAKYVYGVTATPFRGDGLDKINFMLIGPIRYQYTAKEKAAEQEISHFVVPRFTRTVSPHGREKININEAYELIRNNDVRDEQIIEDIKMCVINRRTPVVLTRYTEHAEKIYKNLINSADRVFLLTGKKSKKEQQVIRQDMETVNDNETMILVATGQLVGEGFDYPRLDTLIMATPVAWKGIVEQYAGRLNRDYDGKKDVLIYDYVDMHIPAFDRMYSKRLKAYKRIGYQIKTEESFETKNVNAIYDSDTYLEAYERDLLNSKKDVVISSPSLGASKVYHIIKLLKTKQEAGLNITIVTWHPDSYMYGKDMHRIELMESLRKAGFNIELMEEHCEHYAVIDNNTVWYGSMNLLSKEDIDDNIMRIESKNIAAELLEMTFHKGNKLLKYGT